MNDGGGPRRSDGGAASRAPGGVAAPPFASLTIPGYRIEGELGHGGMSVVYLATDLQLERKVALKLLSPALAQSQTFRSRFLRESRLAASIDHPNIIPIYAAGESDGHLYIAMRYVEGVDLRRLIAAQGGLATRRTLTIVSQIADALDAAHEHHLVHRDVKPANVLLVPRSGPDGGDHAYLTDFGLTKSVEGVSTSATATGHFMGTINYTAPEQIKGEAVDGRADLYSLACLAYECLTGRVPFPRDLELATLWAHVQDPPPKVSEHRRDLPVAIDDVIAHGLAKTPDERPPTGKAFVGELRAALGVAAPESRRQAVRPRPRRIGRRGRTIGATAVVVAAVLITAPVLLVPRSEPVLVPGVDTVARIDATTHAVDTIAKVGADPTGVAVGAGAVWVLNERGGTFTRVDPRTGEPEATMSALGVPTGIAIGEGAVWITNGFGGIGGGSEVVRVDPGNDRAEAAFDSPDAKAIAVAYGSIWLADEGGDRVLAYDPMSYRRTAVIAMPEKDSAPTALTVGTGSTAGIWVVNELSGTVVRIDPETMSIERRWDVDQPTRIAVSDDAVWITSNANDSVTRIDARTGTFVTTLSLEDGDQIPDGPWAIAVARDGVWVTSLSDPVIVRIDPATNEVASRVRIRGVGDSLAVDGAGNAWVTVRRA